MAADISPAGSHNLIPDNQFRLAITMAGAASAGCYTGGVMDYIFETLELWETAKKQGTDPRIPKHEVVIEALGGTSAGGITATMSAIYALNGKVAPVKAPPEGKQTTGNLFYDSWVVMQDGKTNTFQQLWELDDLDKNVLGSLLNSSFIDSIADRLFSEQKDLLTQTKALPGYISQDLQLLLSHTFLRGVPLEVNFETDINKKGRKSIIPNHTTWEHYLTTQYHLNKGLPPDAKQYLWLNPYGKENNGTLQLSTKATGAFPLGLLYRKFDATNLDPKLLETFIKRIVLQEMGNPDPDIDNKVKLKDLPADYSSLSVDGGAINNEPYREVMNLLQYRYGKSVSGYQQYGVVMIDPFPDQAKSRPPYKEPSDLLDVVPSILGALVDQTRVKRRELLESEDVENFRSIIFPRKWNYLTPEAPDDKKIKPELYPLASASALAFGGLLDIRFRKHDYFLGRNNARNFIRRFFTFPYDPANGIIHPIHKGWTAEMIELFKTEKDGVDYLPIIPDLTLIEERATASNFKQYDYTVPEKPKYDPAALFAMEPAINARWIRIFEVLKSRPDGSAPENTPITKALLEKQYPKGRLSRWSGWIGKKALNLFFAIFKTRVAKQITRKIFGKILAELELSGYL